MNTFHFQHKEVIEYGVMVQESKNIRIPVYCSVASPHIEGMVAPHSTFRAFFGRAQNVQCGEHGRCLYQQHIHAPLRGAFLADSSKELLMSTMNVEVIQTYVLVKDTPLTNAWY